MPPTKLARSGPTAAERLRAPSSPARCCDMLRRHSGGRTEEPGSDVAPAGIQAPMWRVCFFHISRLRRMSRLSAFVIVSISSLFMALKVLRVGFTAQRYDAKAAGQRKRSVRCMNTSLSCMDFLGVMPHEGFAGYRRSCLRPSVMTMPRECVAAGWPRRL